MTDYRLHYAGRTFDLRGKDDADRVFATLKAMSGREGGAITTVKLAHGTLQLVISRYVPVAVSTVPFVVH